MKKNGFTLLELLITVLIISIVAGMSILYFNGFVGKNKVNNAATGVAQILQEAQNYAKTKSQDISAVFETNKVSIQKSNGTELNSLDFEENVFYDATGSTISSDKVVFDFKGSPLGTDLDPYSFTAATGKIKLCFGMDDNCAYSKTLVVQPITGAVKEE